MHTVTSWMSQSSTITKREIPNQQSIIPLNITESLQSFSSYLSKDKMVRLFSISVKTPAKPGSQCIIGNWLITNVHGLDN